MKVRNTRRGRWVLLGLGGLLLALIGVATLARLGGQPESLSKDDRELRHSVAHRGARWRVHDRWGPRIRGRVVGTTGMPISGASVCAVCATCDISVSPPGHCSRSGSSGEFSLDHMPSGSFLVSAVHAGFAAGAANDGAPVEVVGDRAVEDVVIELVPSERSLTGLVLDATGGPIAQARVQVARVHNSVRPFVELATDEEGRFAVSLPSGDVTIRAESPGYSPSLAFRTVPSFDVELMLSPGSTIAGTVVDEATEEPLAGVDVSASGSQVSTLLAPVSSDAEGRFSLLGLEPGRYFLSAAADNQRGQTPQPVHVGFGERVDGVVLRVASGALVTGHVLLADTDEPCREGSVRVGPPQRSAQARSLKSTGSPLARDRTVPRVLGQIEHSGLVRLRGLIPGRYEVSVECTGHVYQQGPLTLDVYDQDLSATWRVAVGLGLVVNVKDGLGKPVPHARLMLEFPATASGEHRLMGFPIDAEGRGTLVGSLLPGRYLLHPHESYAVEPMSVELHSGDGTRTVELTLPGVSSLRVQVRTTSGAAVDDVDVEAKAVTPDAATGVGVARRATPLGSSEFLIQALPAGEYTVTINDGFNPPHEAEGTAGKVIRLRPGEEAVATAVLSCSAELSGVVRDERGAPVSDVWIRAAQKRRAGDESSSSLSLYGPRRALSDEDGRFVLKGLCADATYMLRAEDHGRAFGQLDEIRPGAGISLTIQRGFNLQGVVLLPDGEPATEYVLSVHHEDSQRSVGTHVQSKDGSFTINNLPPGEVYLDARSSGLSVSTKALVGSGEKLNGLLLRLTPIPAAPPAATEG